jgi:uncharacterized protein (TIGR02118 family)
MTKVYAMYRQPADPAAFDRYYFSKHIPTAKRLPGLTGYEVTRGTVTTLEGAAAPYYLIATLSFASRAAVQAALASPEGAATAGDLANFATGGVDIFVADTEMV